MKCTKIELPEGGFAIVCGSRRMPAKCNVPGCGVIGTRLCDWKMDKEGTTCDVTICTAHSFTPAANKDLCPKHAGEYCARQGKK